MEWAVIWPNLVTIVVTLGAFWLAYVTSVRTTSEMNKGSRALKLAEFRVHWMDAFRAEIAEMVRINVEMADTRKQLEATKPQEKKTVLRDQLSRLRLESLEHRGRLLLRLNPETTDENEKELETILKQAINSEREIADAQRRKIVALSRLVLKAEWERVKTEINRN